MWRSGAERPVMLLALAAIGLGCSTTAQTSGSGGASGSETGGVSGTNATLSPGSCTAGVTNPDSEPGGACAAECQSVSCGKPCTVDCCTSCGPDGMGLKICTCRNPGGPYSNCACVLPGDAGGPGPCSPQGYSTSEIPPGAPAGSISLRGAACTRINVVCFTADSTPTSPRACMCTEDGTLHCSALSHNWSSSGVPTSYN